MDLRNLFIILVFPGWKRLSHVLVNNATEAEVSLSFFMGIFRLTVLILRLQAYDLL